MNKICGRPRSFDVFGEYLEYKLWLLTTEKDCGYCHLVQFWFAEFPIENLHLVRRLAMFD